jgi:hypothetical protein
MLGSSDEVNLCPRTVYPIGSMPTVSLPGEPSPSVEPVHNVCSQEPTKGDGG